MSLLPRKTTQVAAGRKTPQHGAAARRRAVNARWHAATDQERIRAEHNKFDSGVFKNAIDWLSSPPADIKRVFGGKPVALIGASPGAFGTILSQSAWLPVLRTLGTKPWFGGRLHVSRAQTVFDQNGTMTDAAIQAQVQQLLAGFVDFVRSA